MTGDVSINQALDFQLSTQKSSAQLAKDFTAFLVLLTTQLQNQDPLSPMSSTEFTNQLVNFAGVEQQINANSKLDALVAMGIGTGFSSALSYVGKDISYLSAEAFYDGSKPLSVKYSVEGNPSDTTVNILDSAGRLVYSEKVTANQKLNDFTWNGQTNGGAQAGEGTYTIRVDSLDNQNKPLRSSTVVTGYVRGVESQNGSTFLLVGERAVSLGNVINVSEPRVAANTNTNTETDS